MINCVPVGWCGGVHISRLYLWDGVALFISQSVSVG